MISRLRGSALSIKPPTAVIDVNGVGYKLTCSQAALETLAPGRTCDLHTHMIVREDDISLYGFVSEEEISLFLLLLSVQGVGARTAIAMLSKLSPQLLRSAIVNQQTETLSRVPGIGKKTAEKIVFVLKDKLSGLDVAPGGDAASTAPISTSDVEVISALTSLGYSIAEAQAAFASLPRGEKLDLEEKLRRCLAYFG
ncbi:MAG: Holliday junction branch migration protein RuvA [Chloroflexi bacterium]|nr:Holliday junction branch migration protein RuvA [Chloroflexota bacterium]